MSSEIYFLPSILFVLFILLILIYFLIKYKKAVKKNQLLITEQEEKIKWLRQTFSENEHQFIQKEHALEKQILLLNAQINSLEEKAKDGTKNQVVNKIEALQSKRGNLLQRAKINLG